MKVAFHRAKPIDQEGLAPAQLREHLTCAFPALEAVERSRFVMVADLADLIFSSKAELIEVLRTFYGDILATDVLSVFEFTLGDRQPQSPQAFLEHSSAA